MAAQLRLGLAGYGLWAHSIPVCDVLKDRPEAKVVAVYDAEERLARRLAEAAEGATPYTDLDAFCAADFDAAILSGRTSEKLREVQALAAAGKPILNDKHMGLTVAECRAMIAACERAGVMMMAGYNLRYTSQFHKMREILQGGELGRLLHIFAAYDTPPPSNYEWEATETPWYFQRAYSTGGGFLYHGDHYLDLIPWLSGATFRDVSAQMAKLRFPDYELEDFGVAHFTLQNGASVLLESNAIAQNHSRRQETWILCEKGRLHYVNHTVRLANARLRVSGLASAGGQEVEFLPTEADAQAFLAMLLDFVRCVATGSPPTISAEEGMAVIAAAEAAYRSAAAGSITVPVEGIGAKEV